MNNLEEEYKARFKDAESLEGIDAETLWGQIADKLPTLEPQPKAENTARKARMGRPLLLLLLLAYCAPMHKLLKTESSTKSHAAPIVETAQHGEEMPYHYDEPKLGYDNNILVTPQRNTASKTFIANTNTAAAQPHAKQTPGQPYLPDEASSAQNSSATTSTMVPLLPQLPKVAYQNLKTEQAPVKHYIAGSGSAQENTAPPIQPKEKKWQIGFVAGIHQTRPMFGGTSFGESLNRTHAAAAGYAFSIEIHRKINQKCYVSTGLGYTHAPSIFDFVRQWDTVMYRNQNPNADIIRAKATRTVVHHNQLNYLHLPVALGVQHSLGHFTLGAQAGAGLHFILSSEGKSINKNGTIALINPDLPAYKPVFFSLNAQPFLAYRLKARMTLRMDYNLRYQYHGASDFWGLKASSLYSGVSVGGFWAF